MNTDFKTYIQSLDSISLQEMDSVVLMKRTDTKFIVPFSKLVDILKRVGNTYKVLSISDHRIMSYSSMYFDTPTSKFYNDHHNGRVNRTKIRIRNYVESNLFFLEIKKKNGKGETIKSRIKISDFEKVLSPRSSAFIEETINQKIDLQPALVNKFNRVTLVSVANQERVTIDLNLEYAIDDKTKSYTNLVVVELKQERFNRNSAIVKSLRYFGYNPYSISKYCIGMVSLNKNIKYNAFKQKVRKINKIIAA